MGPLAHRVFHSTHQTRGKECYAHAELRLGHAQYECTLVNLFQFFRPVFEVPGPMFHFWGDGSQRFKS